MIVFALTDACARCASTMTYRLDDAGREEAKLTECVQADECNRALCREGRREAARLKPSRN